MEETQQTVGEWIDQTFLGNDPEAPRMALRALEEMAELCIASGANVDDMMKAVMTVYNKAHNCPKSGLISKPEFDKIPYEAADVLILLYKVAHMRRFDLHEAVDKKMEINRSRKWASRGDGTGYHIKEQVT